MTKSSFYADGNAYAEAVVVDNDTTPPQGNSKAPSSFYPNGTAYEALHDSDSVLADMTALKVATEAAAAAGAVNAEHAQDSADDSAASAAAALVSENHAATSETNAATSATNSANSATTSAGSASTATTQAGIATTKASQAATSATNAATSETNALASKNAAATSATNAATSETNALASKNAAATSATNAATSETNALASKNAAATSATNASTSETNALASKNAASTSATNAATSETNALASKNAAATSATNASTSATNAATSETNALNSLKSFRDVYYGSLASNPSLDPDGNACNAGDFYWNSTAGELRIFNGSSWNAYSASGGAPTTSDYLVKTSDAGLSAERVVTDTSTIRWDWTTSGLVKANAFVPGRNVIINGQFEIDQRNNGVGTSTSDNTYWADRWRYVGEAAAVVSSGNFNQAGGNVLAGTLSFSGTTDKGGVFQVVRGKNCKHLRGKSVTLSLLLQVSNVRLANMKIGILEWTGTEDATTGDPVSAWGADGVTPTLATNWTFKNTPVNLGATTSSLGYSVTATLGTSFNNLAVLIWNDDKSYSAGDSFSVSSVQLEDGSYGSPYDQRLGSQELALCLPYCEALGSGGTVAYELFCGGFALSSTVFYGIYNYAVKKIKVPTVAYSAANTFIGNTAAGIVVGTTIATAAGSQSSLQIQLSGTGFTAGGGGSLQANNTAAARIIIDAEI